ncbi:hypothetical protein AB6A40_005531 [Gnathostoma spinigerum]|uniref:Uncharacterized protein n=1 Tax=Gnathostoma spinigerum TaxID=75299 RepID=A0ABD6EHX1_9BILA
MAINGYHMAKRIRIILNEFSDTISEEYGKYKNGYDMSGLLDVLEKLADILGDVVVEALSIAEQGKVQRLIDPISRRSLYEVSACSTQSYFYNFDDVNYCQCQVFQERVLKQQSAFSVILSPILLAPLKFCVCSLIMKSLSHFLLKSESSLFLFYHFRYIYLLAVDPLSHLVHV